MARADEVKGLETDMGRRKRTLILLFRAVSALAVVMLIVGGVWLVVLAQRVSQRTAYQALATGPPCPMVASEPGYFAASPLRTAKFAGARFGYVHGDVDCQSLRPGRLFHNDETPFCVFDRPAFLSVAYGASQSAYRIVIGQASVRLDDGAPKCIVLPPP